MSQEAHARANSISVLLIIVGVVHGVSFALSFASSGLSLFAGIVSGAFQLASATDDAERVMSGGMTLWTILFQGSEFLVNLILIPLAALTVRGGLELGRLGSPAKVRMGAITAIVAPLLSLVSGVLTLMTLDCCGLVFGSIWAILLSVMGVLAGSMAFSTLSDGVVSSAMTQEG